MGGDEGSEDEGSEDEGSEDEESEDEESEDEESKDEEKSKRCITVSKGSSTILNNSEVLRRRRGRS